MTRSKADVIISAAAFRATPGKARRKEVDRAVKEVLKMLEIEARRSTPRPRIEVGGSYAHDTWLPDQTDIDYFLIYPKTVTKERLGELGMTLAETALRGHSPHKRYAEHPYIEADYGPVTVNAVPCYDVRLGEWMSAADRSPYHTRYMEAHLKDDLRLQARVLKLFLKAQGLYGAEIRVRGFSGYACEVLALKYGSFAALVRAAASWERGSPLSIEGGEKAAQELFKGQPFILLDPVDVTRNLGHAVSPSKLGEFIHLCRAFQEKPDSEYFRSAQLKRRSSVPAYARDHVLLLSFRYEPKSEDILWGELWKSVGGIVAHMEKEGLTVLRHAVAAEGGRAAFAFMVSPFFLPKARRREGPEVFMQDATRRFLRASRQHGDSWWVGEDLRTHVLVKGLFLTPADLLDDFMEEPVGAVGFAKGLAELAKESHRIVSGQRAFDTKGKVEVQALTELGAFRF